ncbi:MAG: zf-HC2 domain-containing protein [Clostridiaceae bacterium]|jgi:hypothetical protein|nr:zf-HC2 domain-containing protein [Clostridiaceae bacterium]
MKKCEEILELLSLYIDNELDDETSKLVKKHVELCSLCKDELEQLQQIVKICNDMDEVELPDNFNEVLHQKLKLESRKMEEDKKIVVKRNRIMKTITSVAAIFIVIFAVRGFMNIIQFGMSFTMNKADVFDVMSNEGAKNSRDYGSDLSTKSTNKIVASENAFDKELADGTDAAKEDATNSNDNDDGKQVIMFSETISDLDTTDEPKASVGDQLEEEKYFATNMPVEEAREIIITMSTKTENIESEKLKITQIADKFGTKVEVDTDLQKYAFVYKDWRYDDNLSISYTMDQTSYDKFVKEVEDNYRGQYSITKDEGHLSGRLKEIDRRIKDLEKNELVNADECKSLSDEKERVVKQLDNLNSNNMIRVEIKINSD